MEQSDHQEYVHQPKNKLALFASYTVIILINVTLSAVILFVSAGQINWLAGWVYLLSYLIYMLVVSSYTIHRTKNVPTINKAPLWERFLDQGYLLIHPLILVLAGLEFRLFQQPSTLLIFFQIGAFALMLIAFALMGWAQAVNPYYGYPVNAIDQTDQEFISMGPYEFSRHPGYAGMALLAIARPVVLGSYWGLLPGLVGFVMVIIRTFLEDKALLVNPNYHNYAAKVRYRLLEGVW